MMPFQMPCATTDTRKQIPLSTNYSSLSSQRNFWHLSFNPDFICHPSHRHDDNHRKRKRPVLTKDIGHADDLNLDQDKVEQNWNEIASVFDDKRLHSFPNLDQWFMTDHKVLPEDDHIQITNDQDLLVKFQNSSPISTNSQLGVSDFSDLETNLSVFGNRTPEPHSYDAASYAFPWQVSRGIQSQNNSPRSDQCHFPHVSPKSQMAPRSLHSGVISEPLELAEPSEVHRNLSMIISPPTKRYWSALEDQQLLVAVSLVRETYDFPLPWGLVADAMEGRTANMCSKRYRQLQRQGSENRGLSYTRGSWTPEEDLDLMRNVERCKATSHTADTPLPWTKIGSMLKQPRSGLQVCARYTEALDPRVTRGRWSKEEDTKLLEEYIRLAGRWSLICQQIEGRTQRQCASRYGVLMGKNKTRRDQ